MSTRTLTITLRRPDETPIEGSELRARLVDKRGRPTSDATIVGSITTLDVTATTDASGVATLDLVPNKLGSGTTLYAITAEDPDTGAMLLRRPGIDAKLFVMPDGDVALEQTGDPSELDEDVLSAAAVSAYFAELWASYDDDEFLPQPPGDGAERSAKREADRAADTVAGAIGDIESARDAALTAIGDDLGEAQAAITLAAGNGITAVEEARDQGVGAVEQARDDALSDIAGQVQAAEAAAENAQDAVRQAAPLAASVALIFG